MKTVTVSDQPHGKLSERLAWASAATLAAAALTLGFVLLDRENPLPAPVRFIVDAPGSGKSPGEPTPIAGLIETGRRPVDLLGSFSVSDNGVLVFRSDVREAPNGFTVIVSWPSLLKKK